MISKDNKPIYAKVTIEQYEKISEIADNSNRSISFVVSEIISEYLYNNEESNGR